MTKTFTATITLSDSQYEALQAIYRLEAKDLDEYVSKSVYGNMTAFLSGVHQDADFYERLERMIEG